MVQSSAKQIHTCKTHKKYTFNFESNSVVLPLQQVLSWFIVTFRRNFAFKTDKMLKTSVTVFLTSLTFDQIQEWARRGGTYFLYYVTFFTSQAAFFPRFPWNKMVDSRPSLSWQGHNGAAHILETIILNYSLDSPWKYCVVILWSTY